MGFDRGSIPPNRKAAERPPWTNWFVLVIIVIIVVGLILFL